MPVAVVRYVPEDGATVSNILLPYVFSDPLEILLGPWVAGAGLVTYL